MDPLSTSDLFDQFLAQRRYLKNVTPSTIEWYQTAFKALQKAHQSQAPSLSKSSLQQFVVTTRQRGVKPVSCNTYIKALNAFCLWLRDATASPEPTAAGDVQTAQSLAAMVDLDQQAVKVMKQWKFKPGLKDGKPVAVLVAVEMTFASK